MKSSYYDSVLSEKLDNGMTLLSKDIHGTGLVSLMVFVGAGSTSEGPLFGSGMAHLAEHMIFQGVEHGTDSEMAQKVENMGGEINAYTSHDYTAYYKAVPSEHFNEALEIISSPFIKSTFEDVSFENEKQVVKKEINMRKDNPDVIISEHLWKTVYREHPYKYPLAGYSEILESIELSDLNEFFQKNYVPENMSIAAVGDLPENAREKIAEAFSKIERKPYMSPVYPDEPVQQSLRLSEISGPVTLTRATIAFQAPSYSHHDAPALDVLAMILGKGKSSRLNKVLKQQKELVYSISAWSHTPRGPGIWAVSFVAEDRKRDEAVDEVFLMMKDIKENIISDDEIDKAIKKVESEHLFSLQTVQGQAQDIGTNYTLTGDPFFTEQYLKAIKKVTPEEVMRVARKYLSKDKGTVVLLRPEGVEKKLGTETVEEHRGECDITRFEMDGGLVLLVGEDHSLPLVSIRIVGLGGLIAETEKDNGIYNLMSSLLLKGTKEHSANQIADLIESHGGSFSTYSANNSFGVSFDILKENLVSTLDIASEILSYSTFPEDEIRKVKEEALAAVRARNERPLQFGMLRLKKELFGSYPLGMDSLGTNESIKSISREDLIEKYEQTCCRGNLVISVFGDINAEEVKELIIKLFAKLRNGNRISVRTDSFQDLPEVKKVQIDRKQTQAVMLMGVRGCSVSDRNKYPMEIIAGLFSGQGSEIYRRLREKLGAVYYVGGANVYSLSTGYFFIYAGTNLSQKQNVENGVLEEVQRILNGELYDDELARVKNKLVGNDKRSHQTLSSKAFETALSELYGLGYLDFTEYSSRIQNVSTDEIRLVADKYMEDKERIVLWLLPETSNKEKEND